MESSAELFEPVSKSGVELLNERQKEILELLQLGKSNKEIGEALFISVNTVKYHLKIIYEVLNIKHRTNLQTKK
jgi:DNA-binding CsgD family transcriptional regulator